MAGSIPLERFCRRLGYDFKSDSLLKTALTHRSLGSANNERLEFLGDAVLSLLVAEELHDRFPKAKEGQLSRLRASLVKGVTLAEVANEIELGDVMRLGAGELKSGGFRRESILEDGLEALIGAIYLDGGLESCRQVVFGWFESRLDSLSLTTIHKDPKTRLQEFLQSQGLDLPRYEVVTIEGEAHEQVFTVTCGLSTPALVTDGTGSSRRAAEQQAAESALSRLMQPEKASK